MILDGKLTFGFAQQMCVCLCLSRISHELAEDVLQDASVLEEGDLGVSIQAALHREGLSTVGRHIHILVHSKVSAVDLDVELFRSAQSKGVSRFATLELEGQNSHANKVGSVDALIRLSNHRLDTLQVGSLGGPIARRTRTVLVSCQDNGWLASVLILLSSVKYGHFFARGHMDRGWANLRHHLVDKTHISEGTSCHNLIISSSRSVRVEVVVSNAALLQVASRGRVLGNLSSGRDVIRGD